MRIRKPIIFFANRKKTKWKRVKQFGKKFIHDEQASTMENVDNKQIPPYERSHSLQRKHNHYLHFGKGLKGRFNLKTFVMAAISAIVIGTCLGFIMLNMFDGIGTETNGGPSSGGVPAADTDNAEAGETESNDTLDPLRAFVLQGGVFSSEENATDWTNKFQKADHPAMVWERDNQFMLLAGIAASEEQAKELAEDFTDEDIYVKEWSTEETDITTTKAESEWLKSFADVWKDSVQSLSDDASFTMDTWQQLLNQFPKGDKQLTAFQEQLQQALKQVKENDSKSAGQLFLLDQWLQYEKIGADEDEK